MMTSEKHEKADWNSFHVMFSEKHELTKLS